MIKNPMPFNVKSALKNSTALSIIGLVSDAKIPFVSRQEATRREIENINKDDAELNPTTRTKP